MSGDEGALIVRIAIAVNNFMSGSYLMHVAKEVESKPKTRELGRGLLMYVAATQIGYLYEAMYLISHPTDPEPTLDTLPGLNRYITALSAESKKDYKLLRESIDGKDKADFKRYVENFRNRVSFHYDTGYRGRGSRSEPVTTAALKRLAKTRSVGSMIASTENYLNRFPLADDVMNVAICHEVWGIDDSLTGKDLQDIADRIIEWIVARVNAFTGFGSELCQRCIWDMLDS